MSNTQMHHILGPRLSQICGIHFYVKIGLSRPLYPSRPVRNVSIRPIISGVSGTEILVLDDRVDD